MIKIVRGKVRGKTIELDEDPGVIDGQDVEVRLTMINPTKKLPGPPREWTASGTSPTAGILADVCDEEDDRILEEIHRDRKRETRREIAE